MMAHKSLNSFLETAMLKMMKCLRTAKQQSINCTPFEGHFGRTANTMWQNRVKLVDTKLKLGSNFALIRSKTNDDVPR